MNVGYHLARAEGAAVRRTYQALLPALARRRVRVRGDVPLDVFAYSGESSLPEQVASIRSFLNYAGRPRRFTVVSDGTHSEHSIELLRALDGCVSVSASAEWMPAGFPPAIAPYLTTHATGKQLALIMSLPKSGLALYVDSDVLFFPGAHELASAVMAPEAPALYQADCRFSGDERLLRAEAEKNAPANTGVLMLFAPLDWSRSLERLVQLEGAPSFFTNQTITHLTMHANGALPLDPNKYVLRLDDQFGYRDGYASSAIVLRHYVGPVRHKFWAAVRRTYR